MTVNAGACYLKILIGSDQQDWSATLQSFDVSLPKRDRGGLLPITGTLTLTYWDDAPESMNPRVNAQRWHRGQSIKVLASLDGVTYTPHPCGWLYILKEPLPPHPDADELVLPLGCQLALKDFAEPDNDKAGVILGVATSRTDAITSILAAAGITSWVGAVPLYPIAHPIPKIGGSYVQQAGKVAYAGQKALWQDNQGQIQAVDLRLDPTATPVVDITIGVGGGEIIYKPSEGAETPVEELRCVGLDKIGIDTWRCLSSLPSESYETSNDSGVVNTRITRRTTITDCQGLDDDGRFYKSRREFVEETAGMVYPNDEPGSLRLTFSSDNTTTYLYEPGLTGRLINIRRRVLRPTAAAVASWWANLTPAQKLNYSRISPLPATDEITSFNYQDYPTPQDGSVADQYAFDYQTQVIAGQTTATKAPIAAIAPNEDLSNLSNPLGLTPSGVTTESWAKVRGYEWQKSTIQQAPFIQAAPEAAANSTSISSKIALVTTDDFTDVSAAGGQQPAAPERRPDRYTEIEIQVKGRALFGTPAGSNEQKRFRTIEVEYMVSSEQAGAIAQAEGAILIGRRQGQTILVPFDERFLSGFTPLHLWRCTEPDGTTYIYQADAISFTHDSDRAVVGCEGIWQATIAAGATAHKLPYNEIMPMDGGLCFGGNIRVYPYSLAPVTLTMRGGLKFGGRLAPITTINMRGGLKVGGLFEGKLARSVFGGIKFGGEVKLVNITRSFRGGIKVGGSLLAATDLAAYITLKLPGVPATRRSTVASAANQSAGGQSYTSFNVIDAVASLDHWWQPSDSEACGNITSGQSVQAVTAYIGSNNLAQATSNHRGVFNNAALTFDGSSTFYTPASDLSLETANAFTLFIVASAFSAFTYQSLFRFQSTINGYIVFPYTADQQGTHFIISSDRATNGPSLNGLLSSGYNISVASWKRNTVNGFYASNNGSMGSVFNGADVALPAEPLTVGRYTPGVDEYFRGDLKTLAIARQQYSSTQKAQLERFFNFYNQLTIFT